MVSWVRCGTYLVDTLLMIGKIINKPDKVSIQYSVLYCIDTLLMIGKIIKPCVAYYLFPSMSCFSMSSVLVEL